MYENLVAKLSNVDTSAFVLKTKYQTDKTELKNKVPNVNDFAKKAKLTELEKLQKLKRILLTIIMTNILQLQSLIK